MARKPRAPYKSAMADNARPGSPTTMDVLLRWITAAGNVRRWRSEPRAPLVRELVEEMQAEGLAHRNAPFVRYKVDALEKQYLTAKQWLLETGMHDAFMRGKASKEVKAHVEHLCPQFRALDPAFRGVPFSKKNAETIELDGDSAEEKRRVESEEIEEETGGSEEEKEEHEEEEETPEPKKNTSGAQLLEAAEKEKEEGEEEEDEDDGVIPEPKRNTFRWRLMEEAKKKEASSRSEEPKKTNTFRERLMAKSAEKEKAPEPKKKKAHTSRKILSSAVEVALTQTTGGEKEMSSAPTKPHKKKHTPGKTRLSLTNEVAATEPVSAKVTPDTAESIPEPVQKRRGRPPKSATVAAATTHDVEDTAKKASKQATSQPVKVIKRKNSEEEAGAVKRTRTREHDEAGKEELKEIERGALLKRVQDEQTQRREVFGLERAKLKCELEAKQVQVLFEKAAARKKLDQLGVPQEEIDRILPL